MESLSDDLGFVYGAFQSYARAFYAELLPPGEEARWHVVFPHYRVHTHSNTSDRYGLFSITDKVRSLPLLCTISTSFPFLVTSSPVPSSVH